MSERFNVLHQIQLFLEAGTEVPLGMLKEDWSLQDGLGLDSVELMNLMVRLENHYGIQFNRQEIGDLRTVRDLISKILERNRLRFPTRIPAMGQPAAA
jgi:acyl carrier protein